MSSQITVAQPPYPANIARANPRHSSEYPANINAHDAKVLRVRGISPEVARDYGMSSWTRSQSAAYGFRGDHARDALAIPNPNLAGEDDGVQIRPHEPVGERKYLWKSGHSPQIGGMPTGTPRAAERAQRLLHDPQTPLLAAESNLKIGSLISSAKRDVYGLSIHGNWGWTRNGALSPEFRLIPWREKKHGKVVHRRQLILIPDSDYWTKPEVARGWWEFGSSIREAYKADVRIAVVPTGPNGEKWGPDDAIHAGVITVEELIDTALPLPDIMPAVTVRPADTAKLSEVDQLRRENAELKADRDAIIALVLNPNISPTEKIAFVSAGVEVQKMAEKGKIDTLDNAKISNDYRSSKRPKGEPKPTVNPETGTVPMMARDAVKPALQRAKDMGWMVAHLEPGTITRSNGTSYTDTVWRFEPTASLATFIGKAATYKPDAPKERKPYTFGNVCPHCHTVHDQVQVTYCGGITADGEILDGCEKEIKRRVIRKPLTSRTDITTQQREHLENITRAETLANPDESSMSGLNQDIVTPTKTDSAPAPVNCPELIRTCDEPAPENAEPERIEPSRRCMRVRCEVPALAGITYCETHEAERRAAYEVAS